MKLLSLSLLFTFLSLNVFSQDSENISEYLDDGGFSTSKNVIKLNIATIIIGDVPFSYERMLSKRLSIEVGFGKLMGYYNPDLWELISSDLEREIQIKNPKGGYSFVIFPRYYLKNDAPLWMYYGFKFRKRNYTFENNGDIIITDATINFGTQFPVLDRFVIDYNMGLGFRFSKSDQLNGIKEENAISLPFAVKIGYLF